MTRHFNKHSELQKRKRLRNNATKAERILWKYLKNNQLENSKIRRQYSIDQFVLDFYCPDLKLAIEIDGKSHLNKDQIPYDIERQNYIKSFGIQFLRFTNDDVYNNIESVLTQISCRIKDLKRSKNTTPQSPPYQGGDIGEVRKVSY